MKNNNNAIDKRHAAEAVQYISFILNNNGNVESKVNMHNRDDMKQNMDKIKGILVEIKGLDAAAVALYFCTRHHDKSFAKG